MLNKLGRNLTLVNVVVSGAILILMAFLALGVVEHTITAQNEMDLTMYARSTLAALSNPSPLPQSVAFSMQLPERYMVYAEDADGQPQLITQELLPEEDRFFITSEIKKLFGTETNALVIADEEGIKVSGPTLFAVKGMAGGMQISTISMPIALRTTLLPEEDRIGRFRVASSMVGGEDNRKVMVMQNREDEMAARYRLRWLFFFCVLGGLLLIVISSLFLSRRAIKPIEKSLAQQKAFVAAASHELRTPVTALRANAEVLGDAPLGDFAPYLESIRSVSERMSLLITDLIDIARADAGELQVNLTPVELYEVGQSAVQWIQPIADEQGITLENSLKPVLALGDANRINQVLLALLDNALRYTDTGGRIGVTITTDAHHAIIRVSDTGVGVADEYKEAVFERFYRIDASRARNSGGAGLGLSVVKQLVTQMKGTISVFDNAPCGTVFEIRLKLLAHERKNER